MHHKLLRTYKGVKNMEIDFGIQSIEFVIKEIIYLKI